MRYRVLIMHIHDQYAITIGCHPATQSEENQTDSDRVCELAA